MACNLGFTPTDNENYYFLSYNKEDADRVSEIAQQISRTGIELWYDNGIKYGERWERTIAEKIYGCQAVILFFTRGILYKVDSYVEKEYEMARRFGRTIYYVMLDNIVDEEVPPKKMPWWIVIKATQCIEAHEIADPYRIVEEIAVALAITKEHGTGDAQKDSASIELRSPIGASVSSGKARQALPTIKEKILPPCEPFIEGIHRMEDLANVSTLLTCTNKTLWLYGESGIGKTELIRQFASQHPEYEYIFTTFSGSINQTVSQNLFNFREYELNGMELKDIVRYHKNMAVFSEYSRQLKEGQRSLVFIIDNYNPINYEEDCRKEIGLDIHSGIAGEKNDVKEIGELLKTGVKVILIASQKPHESDVYTAYEIRGLDENDQFAVMTGCFTKILPYINEEGIREKLINLVRIAGNRTVFVTIMAFAMQNSKLGPKEALNEMLETFDADEAYDFRYSSDTLKMHDHIERILKFINLTYQEKPILAILAMLPDQGMRLEFFRKLMTSNPVQSDRMRQAALRKLIDTNIVITECQQNEPSGSDGETGIICMSPLVADHALRVLAGRNPGTLLNSIRMNWVSRLLRYIDSDNLKSLKKDDKKFMHIPMLAEACSAAEQKLKKLGGRYNCDEEVAVSRRDLLMKASELSDKVGNVKDALEYVERAIAVEGPYAEDMYNLALRINSVGLLFFKGGKYNRAKKCFIDCLKVSDE